MKTGLYFGSFNPIHIGHLIIANHILNETDIDEVWFVVSPQRRWFSIYVEWRKDRFLRSIISFARMHIYFN
jgi:cytidyltransferase-like protein